MREPLHIGSGMKGFSLREPEKLSILKRRKCDSGKGEKIENESELIFRMQIAGIAINVFEIAV